MTQSSSVTLPNGLQLVECFGASGLVPRRKCVGKVGHEMCDRSRSLESSRILFRQDQTRPERKTKRTRRLPRLRDYGSSGRIIGEWRKPRNWRGFCGKLPIKPKRTKLTKRERAILGVTGGIPEIAKVANFKPKVAKVERVAQGRKTADQLKVRQGLAIGMKR